MYADGDDGPITWRARDTFMGRNTLNSDHKIVLPQRHLPISQ
jgi:hypothetical protein